MIDLLEDGIAVIRSFSTPAATQMTVEESLALEQQTQFHEDLQGAGLEERGVYTA